MDTKIIALAIPFFFLLIGVELAATRRRRERLYRLHDAISSLSCGVGQQVIGVFLRVVPFAIYTFLYTEVRLFDQSMKSPFSWALCIVLLDLAYWVYHWASHRVNFFWATHVVHHQSEEYNLSTALRQSWFTAATSWLFYAPLAILGFPPEMYGASYSINLLYQFWIHTRAVRSLGPLEWVLNTPAHHRVHHGTDPAYIDKNYAGIFIVWDRLFGTFTPETREPVYGIVGALSSWNPLWANVEPFVKLWKMSRATSRWRDKLYVWIAPPEWRPRDLGGPVTVPEVSRDTQKKYSTKATSAANAYIVFGFAVVSLATGALLWFGADLTWLEKGLISALVLIALVTWSGLSESRPWATPLIVVHAISVVAVAAWWTRASALFAPVVASAAVFAVGLAVWGLRARPATSA